MKTPMGITTRPEGGFAFWQEGDGSGRRGLAWPGGARWGEAVLDRLGRAWEGTAPMRREVCILLAALGVVLGGRRVASATPAGGESPAAMNGEWKAGSVRSPVRPQVPWGLAGPVDRAVDRVGAPMAPPKIASG